MGDDDPVLRRHLDAVQGDHPLEFLRVVEADGVALGRISLRLDDVGRKALVAIQSYCRRWRSEGGPHEDTQPPLPVGGDLWEIHQWRADRSGHPELLPWNAPQIQHMRGIWAGVLERLLAGSERPVEPCATQEDPRSPPESPALRTQAADEAPDRADSSSESDTGEAAHADPTHWVPVSFCIQESNPLLRDHKAVSRFCEKYGVPMRRRGQNRRDVNLDAFREVLRKIEEQVDDLSTFADRVLTERRRKQGLQD